MAGVTLLIKELLAGCLNYSYASNVYCKMKYCSCVPYFFIWPRERGGSKAVGGDIKLLKPAGKPQKTKWEPGLGWQEHRSSCQNYCKVIKFFPPTSFRSLSPAPAA